MLQTSVAGHIPLSGLGHHGSTRSTKENMFLSFFHTIYKYKNYI